MTGYHIIIQQRQETSSKYGISSIIRDTSNEQRAYLNTFTALQLRVLAEILLVSLLTTQFRT